MEQQKLRRTAMVKSPRGFHLRPWSQFAELASRFDAAVEVVNGSTRADARSTIHLMTLAAVEGTKLTLEGTGPQAEQAVEQLAQFIEDMYEDLETSGSEESN